MSLTIKVLNSDLSFLAEPLLIGHYTSLGLTGSEAAVDKLLGGVLQRSLRAGAYPQKIGESKIFHNSRLTNDNPWQMPRPTAIIVVGIGPEASLRSEDLKAAVSAAIVEWSLDVERRASDGAPLKIAATLIGSGGMNMSAAQSAQLIVQAVIDANERLASVDVPEGVPAPPFIADLTLTEVYLDRAADAWRALNQQQASGMAEYQLESEIVSSDNSLERPLETSYRGSSYDLIVATWQDDNDGGEGATITYRLDTRRARSEVRGQSTQVRLLQQLLRDSGTRDAFDRTLGRTLFRLLIPSDVAFFLEGSTETLIELDLQAAGIPWELLDTPKDGQVGEQRPWALRSKLLRKLRTRNEPARVEDASYDAGILVIGEPLCPPEYPRLPGARREARMVAALMTEANPGGAVRAMISRDAPDAFGASGSAIVRTLLSRSWRVLHVCGHGEPSVDGKPRGIVLSDDSFLGPREVKNLQPVPELVFVNCCFVGAHGPDSMVSKPRVGSLNDAPSFAANLADQLIEIGVRCVIATGWAIDDEVAEIFAGTFYRALLAGNRFIDAVSKAREAAYAKETADSKTGNTWAAYQCYGDPDWRWRLDAPDAQSPRTALETALGNVASVPGLRLALRTLVVRAEYHAEKGERQVAALDLLEKRFATTWALRGDIAEAFGRARHAMGDETSAVAWFEKALAANDGRASLKCPADLYNLRVRKAAGDALGAIAKCSATEPATATNSAADSSEDVAVDAGQIAAAAIADIDKTLQDLLALDRLSPNPERANLCGSACKRIAMICFAAGSSDAALWIARMRDHYRRGWDLVAAHPSSDTFYSAMNVLAADIAAGDDWDDELATQVKALIARDNDSAPDFWNVSASIELEIWNAVVRAEVATREPVLAERLRDLRERVAHPGMWGSVRDQTALIVRSRFDRLAPAKSELDASNRLAALLATFAQPA